MVDYKIIDKNEYLNIENVRMEVYGLDSSSIYFVDKLTNGEIIPVGVYLNGLLIGGAYVSKSFESLYIDNIFIKYDYQGNGYAKGLLKYIFSNKKIFEEYFHQEFYFSRLEPNSNSMVEFYKSIGFSEPNDMNIMKKRI